MMRRNPGQERKVGRPGYQPLIRTSAEQADDDALPPDEDSHDDCVQERTTPSSAQIFKFHNISYANHRWSYADTYRCSLPRYFSASLRYFRLRPLPWPFDRSSCELRSIASLSFKDVTTIHCGGCAPPNESAACPIPTLWTLACCPQLCLRSIHGRLEPGRPS